MSTPLNNNCQLPVNMDVILSMVRPNPIHLSEFANVIELAAKVFEASKENQPLPDMSHLKIGRILINVFNLSWTHNDYSVDDDWRVDDIGSDLDENIESSNESESEDDDSIFQYISKEKFNDIVKKVQTTVLKEHIQTIKEKINKHGNWFLSINWCQVSQVKNPKHERILHQLFIYAMGLINEERVLAKAKISLEQAVPSKGKGMKLEKLAKLAIPYPEMQEKFFNDLEMNIKKLKDEAMHIYNTNSSTTIFQLLLQQKLQVAFIGNDPKPFQNQIQRKQKLLDQEQENLIKQ